MRNMSFCLVSFLVALCVSTPSQAALIGFDSFSDYQNINGINLGGVTITASDNIVYALANGSGGTGYVSPYNCIAASYWDAGMKLLLTFDTLTGMVSIVGGDMGGDSDDFSMEAFDTSMVSLGMVDTGVFSGADPLKPLTTTFGDYRTLTLNTPGIKYVELTQVTWGTAWDNLEFDGAVVSVVPVPGALLLGTIGTGLIGWLRRRRTL